MMKIRKKKSLRKSLGGHPSGPKSLKNQAYEQIHFDIVSYALKPGEKISEADLSRRYGLGHAPLRSALQRLVEQGLVLNRRRLGHVVTPITVRDIRDIFFMRRLLEPVAVELAAAHISRQQLAELRERCDASYKFDPKQREKNVEFLAANRAFCVAIARTCGNDRLGSSIEHLQDLTLRILYLGLRPKLSGTEDEGFQANSATLDALIAGDAKRARELYAKSLEVSEKWVLSGILNLPKFQDMNVARLDIP